MDEAEAMAWLERAVDASSDPALSPLDLMDALSVAARRDAAGNPPSNVPSAPEWAPSARVVVGAVVQAAGRFWRAARTGTTGDAAPAWPRVDAGGPTHATVSDGGLVWEDAGVEWAPTWNLAAAEARAWERRAAKAAGRFSFATDGQRFERGQVLDHCRRMAADARRRMAASVPLGAE